MTENLNTFPKASTEEIQIYFHIFFQTNCLSVTEEELVLCVNGFSLGHCSCRFSSWLYFWTGPLSRVLGSVLWLTVDRTANVTHHRTTAQSSYHPQSDSLWEEELRPITSHRSQSVLTLLSHSSPWPQFSRSDPGQNAMYSKWKLHIWSNTLSWFKSMTHQDNKALNWTHNTLVVVKKNKKLN